MVVARPTVRPTAKTAVAVKARSRPKRRNAKRMSWTSASNQSAHVVNALSDLLDPAQLDECAAARFLRRQPALDVGARLHLEVVTELLVQLAPGAVTCQQAANACEKTVEHGP